MYAVCIPCQYSTGCQIFQSYISTIYCAVNKRMAKFLILMFIISITQISCLLFMNGLLLNPEILKVPIGRKIGNDYMDYNLDHNAQEVVVVTIPADVDVTAEKVIENNILIKEDADLLLNYEVSGNIDVIREKRDTAFVENEMDLSNVHYKLGRKHIYSVIR